MPSVEQVVHRPGDECNLPPLHISIGWEQRVQQEVHCASYESLWVTPRNLHRALISPKSSLFSIDSTPVSLSSKYAPVGLNSTVTLTLS